MKRRIVQDDKIFHIWADPDTGEEIEVTPDWYEQNGTPCTENGDCHYLRTEMEEGKREDG